MATVHRHPAAQEDLIEHAVYLAIEAGQGIADRFVENAEKSFNVLASQPTIGAPLGLRDPRLAELRKWAISGFESTDFLSSAPRWSRYRSRAAWSER